MDITQNSALFWIVFIPLLGAGISYLCKWFKEEASGVVASTASIISFLITIVTVSSVSSHTVLRQELFQWLPVSGVNISFALQMDALSAVMALVVTGVGSLIHIYSIGYMAEDPSKPRFFAYLNLFMFSMLLLVLGGNLAVLFIGWEGVGLCSYLLIGFWYKNFEFAKAGRKAFVVNRIGDAGFLLGIFLLLKTFGTVDYLKLLEVVPGQGSTLILMVIALGLFVGATGKSAQIPLYVWLPDAMAGPTPVSALIHAATMVTAGVYMVSRLHYLFEAVPQVLGVIVLIAVATAFVAATIALTQRDIKKVLAYSTVSQLGFMFMAAGAGVYWAALFHLVTHAFFKACLFLSAGSVIHGCHHEQDMTKLGGLKDSMPWTAAAYGISTLAIAGVYPFAGYFSKHAIIESLKEPFWEPLRHYSGLIVGVVTFTAFLTAFYMSRSFALTFLGKSRFKGTPHEAPWVMRGVLIALAFLATVGGIALVNLLPEYVGGVLGSSEAVHHKSVGVVEGILSSWVGILGIALGLYLYTKGQDIVSKLQQSFSFCWRLLFNKYWVDEIYDLFIVKPLYFFSLILAFVIDTEVVDGAVNGAAAASQGSGEVLRYIQSGKFRFYALCMVLASGVFLTLVALR
ncbi:MAG: NADH-quinone oxidoreductase subunit L [Candidatus Dadabacteria bacterium]|nr:MAG: NADH-quinone oxidoreductase subunit L [Candidatus Dadabacteria bacterium]